jgi:hypothetical protein
MPIHHTSTRPQRFRRSRGLPRHHDLRRADERSRCPRPARYALANGINFIDTAEMYAVPPRRETCGASESIVGRWLKRPATRQDSSRHQGRRPEPQPELDSQRPAGHGPRQHPRRHRGFAAAPADGLHRPLPTALAGAQPADVRPVAVRSGQRPECTPIREQLEALAELVREGKVRHVGVSNEHPWGIMQFTRLADEFGLPRIVSTQNAYSLLNRTFRNRPGRSLPSRTGWPARLFTARLRPPDRKIPGQPQRRRTPDQWPSFGQRYTKPNVVPAVARPTPNWPKTRPDADPVGARLRPLALVRQPAPSSAPRRWPNCRKPCRHCRHR